MHLKAFRGPHSPEGRPHDWPANFYQFTGGRPAKKPRLPAATPKPQQLHKLAVPQPDLFRRQVRPVHAGIRKQPPSLRWLHWQAAPAGRTWGRHSPAPHTLQARLLFFSLPDNTEVPGFGDWIERGHCKGSPSLQSTVMESLNISELNFKGAGIRTHKERTATISRCGAMKTFKNNEVG